MACSFSFVSQDLVSPGMGVGSWEIGFGFGLWFGVETAKCEFMLVPEDVE
jgi:hypothetical protein